LVLDGSLEALRPRLSAGMPLSGDSTRLRVLCDSNEVGSMPKNTKKSIKS